MVIRSYTCLNRRCLNQFNSTEDHPPCPRCGGIKVQWLPRPVAIGKTAAQVDSTVRSLIDQSGRTDLRSPTRGEAMIPKEVSGTSGALPFNPMNGWGMSLPQQCLMGNGAAYCGPVKGSALPPPAPTNMPKKPLPGPTPKFEARHDAPLPKE